jgi:hypothetical protein
MDIMPGVEIHLWFGRQAPLMLTWQVYDNSVSPFWLKYLTHTLKAGHLFKPRFMGFIDGKRDPVYLTNKLNECIEVINRDGRHFIEKKLEGEFTQEFSNFIHHHFEVLIGDEWKKTEYWQASSREVKSAVSGLNDYAHELEAWQRSSEGRSRDVDFTMAYVLTEFYEAPGMDISKGFDDLFTLETNFGDMLLHYGQIGKTWLEICIDQDEDIFDPAIQPLVRLTGAFNINFFKVNATDLKKIAHDHLVKLGKDPSDPSLRLGQLPIAKLKCDGKSEKEIVSLINMRDDISRIEVVVNGKSVVSRDFPPKIERYFV